MTDGLGERDYILGNFSAADIGLGYIVSLADRLDLLGPFPPLRNYISRLQSRPAFQAALMRTGG